MTCQPAREPPQKVRGLGELFGGGRGETFPSWVWAKPMIFSFAFEFGGAVFAPLLFASQSTSRRILVYRVIPNGFGSSRLMCYSLLKWRCTRWRTFRNSLKEICKACQFTTLGTGAEIFWFHVDLYSINRNTIVNFVCCFCYSIEACRGDYGKTLLGQWLVLFRSGTVL